MLPRGRGGLRPESERLTEVMFEESGSPSLPPSCKALSKPASGEKRDDRTTVSEILFLFHLPATPKSCISHTSKLSWLLSILGTGIYCRIPE